MDSYKKAQEWKQDGRLPNVDILFPNIELRFAVNAGKGSPINFHLIVSPEDERHIENAEEFLANLTFKYKETYRCTRAGLIQLGYAHKPNAGNDQKALEIGAEQFKVDPDQLIGAFDDSPWARNNILTAIAASSRDGTAQLQAEGGLAATRKKLERLARIIFSSKSGDREFWLGCSGKIDRDKLDAEYGGPKPCLHGSDSHDHDAVGNPVNNRFCWLKGDLTFETLRQACIEPEGRAFVGGEPNGGGLPANTISQITVKDADWLAVPDIPINSGLVAVIGARGSGKTALVEMIAAGANSIDTALSERSFLDRANPLINEEECSLSWGAGEPTSSSLDVSEMSDGNGMERARYLSQQFVDRLCSSDGLAEELISEIERVIFQAHSPEDRLGASSFTEFHELMTASARRAKSRYKEMLAQIENSLSVQHDLKRSLAQLEKSREELAASIERDKQDRARLTPSENNTILDRLEAVRNAAEKASQDIATQRKRELDLTGLLHEVNQFQGIDANTRLGQLKGKYQHTGFSEEEWVHLRLAYQDDAAPLIEEKLAKVLAAIYQTKGPAEGETEELENREKAPPYLAEGDDLDAQSLSLLQKEQRRLEALVGIDRTRRKRYADISSKISKREADLAKLDKQVVDAKGANDQIEYLHDQRRETYRNIFEEIAREEELLKTLYEPLETNLKAQEGSLKGLTFSVKRHVELRAWTDAGESRLDTRKAGAFRGKNTLHEIAEHALLGVWQDGDPDAIAEAMSNFKNDYGKDLWHHIPEHAERSREAQKVWFDEVSAWLFSTDHIQVNYSLQYEDTDIQQLSPGTRGIVLLLLYLSIDQEDDRPLIIDQPEENLDPQSIYTELVDRFKEAKTRRQVIIVTHNANLVVNTDADQIIVASRGAHRQGQLPVLTYQSGGLENPAIRTAVCKILEGGEKAFTARARRLRIPLPGD